MKRREFLEKAGAASLAAAAVTMKGYVIPFGALLRNAEAETGISLSSLKRALNPAEALLLLPSDSRYAQYQNTFNLRKALKPQARVLVRTPRAVVQLVQWLEANKVPFAVRGGGHSFEGFSQSSSVVIDTRLLNSVELGDATVSVGGGAHLGEVYDVVGARNLAIPGGSCPQVGVSGHAQGGGFGLLGRPMALACDNLLSLEMVNAKGAILQCNDKENTDLFWALRGGGGGSFGVVTRYKFRTTPVKQLVTFGLSFVLPAKKACGVFKAWQLWIQEAPDTITCIHRVMVDAAGTVTIRVAGQSTGSEAQLRAELKKICVEKPTKENYSTLDFLGSVKHFAGTPGYEQVFMKGKSDYLYEPMSDEGMMALFSGLKEHQGIVAIFDGYGGAIAKVPTDATAFFHRKAICSVQYYCQFAASAMEAKLASMKAFHESLRSYVSGYAYVNYPDLDIKDYGKAYWGDNFDRLKKIKAAVDPENIFRHAQSIPL